MNRVDWVSTIRAPATISSRLMAVNRRGARTMMAAKTT